MRTWSDAKRPAGRTGAPPTYCLRADPSRLAQWLKTTSMALDGPPFLIGSAGRDAGNTSERSRQGMWGEEAEIREWRCDEVVNDCFVRIVQMASAVLLTCAPLPDATRKQYPRMHLVYFSCYSYITILAIREWFVWLISVGSANNKPPPQSMEGV